MGNGRVVPTIANGHEWPITQMNVSLSTLRRQGKTFNRPIAGDAIQQKRQEDVPVDHEVVAMTSPQQRWV